VAKYGTVVIVGVGLVGGSIGCALKQKKLSDRVIGIGHRQKSLDLALKKGAIDKASLDAREAVAAGDIVILATPISLIIELSREVMPHLKSGAILTDVGSTKERILRRIASFGRDDVHFIGGHPIAGSEKRGVAQARADLFEGAICVLTPSDKAGRNKVEVLKEFWRDLGCRVMTLSAREHDRILAYVSHLPHLAALALTAGLDESLAPFVGPGFRDTTRIAAGDPNIWSDIFLSNRDEILHAIETFEENVKNLRDSIASGKKDALRSELETLAEIRNKLEGGCNAEDKK